MGNWIYKHRNNHGWQTAARWRILRHSAGLWLRALAAGLLERLPRYPKPSISSGHHSAPSWEEASATEKPLIFASYAVDTRWPGSHHFCGGEKSLNNLVHLLRHLGFEAYMVTLDGTHSNWLIDHAPYISLAESVRLRQTRPHRCVTSWIDAHAFLDTCPAFYYWDHELATASGYQFPRLWDYVASGRIRRLAGFNRVIQAWFMTTFDRPCALVRSMIDTRYWKPAQEKRVPGRVGYMEEGELSEGLISRCSEQAKARGINAEFFRISGLEREVLEQMQSCEIFLTTNRGKHPLWGEGGPLPPQEAMACGTVPVMFDLLGPWEVVVQGVTGWIVPSSREDLFINHTLDLLQNRDQWAAMSHEAARHMALAHGLVSRTRETTEFLDLQAWAK